MPSEKEQDEKYASYSVRLLDIERALRSKGYLPFADQEASIIGDLRNRVRLLESMVNPLVTALEKFTTRWVPPKPEVLKPPPPSKPELPKEAKAKIERLESAIAKLSEEAGKLKEIVESDRKVISRLRNNRGARELPDEEFEVGRQEEEPPRNWFARIVRHE